jgi:hypothetical protein
VPVRWAPIRQRNIGLRDVDAVIILLAAAPPVLLTLFLVRAFLSAIVVIVVFPPPRAGARLLPTLAVLLLSVLAVAGLVLAFLLLHSG